MDPSEPITRQRRRALRAWAVAAAVLAASGVAARASSAFIALRFPDRPTPDDLLFRLLPNISWTQYVADAVLVVGVALAVWYAVRLRPYEGPSVVAMVGLMELARAAINILTPLASPLGNGTLWGLMRFEQNGMFPSGHTGTALLLYLTVDGTAAPRIKRVMLLLFVAECVTLVLGRGHYTIDIVGGILLTYVLWRAWVDGRAFRRLRQLVTP